MKKMEMSYLDYESKVLTLLEDKLIKDGCDRNRLCREYRFIHNNHLYIFDLVELNEKNQILNLYEIKSLRAFNLNRNYISGLLLRYKEVTGANVYIVFVDDEEQLNVLSYENYKGVRQSVRRRVIKNSLVTSFQEFYSKLKLECNNDSGLRYFFRGHSDCEYKSIPSVFRDDNINYEEHLYHEAVRNNPIEFTEDMSTFDKLVKMQHYELPTRLLDITTNPLVALYFACKGNDEKDGAVIIFAMSFERIEYYDSDSVCILSNLSKCPINFNFDKDKNYLLYDIKQDKHNFNENYLEKRVVNSVLCVLPKLNNDRIIRQSGAFFLFGMGISKDKPAEFKDEPITIRIKADCKKDILKELQMLGIDEATLFPETDKIMKQIKSQYIKN